MIENWQIPKQWVGVEVWVVVGCRCGSPTRQTMSVKIYLKTYKFPGSQSRAYQFSTEQVRALGDWTK